MIIFKGSIRLRFNFVLIPIIILGLLAVSLLNTRTALQQLQLNSETQQHSQADAISHNITIWAQTQQQLLISLSNSPYTTTALNNPDSLSTLSDHLAQLAQQFQLRNLALLSPNGKAIAASNNQRIGNDYSAMPYFIEAQKTGQQVISEPRASRVDGKLLVTFALPIAQDHVLFASMSLSNFYNDHIGLSGNDSDQYRLVLSSKCNLLAHPHIDEIDTEANHFKELCGSSGAVEFSVNQQRFSGISKVEQITNWQVFSTENQKVQQRNQKQILTQSLWLTLLITTLVVVAISMLIRRITTELATVVDAINDLSSGNIDLTHLDQQRWQKLQQQPDELGQMAKAMATLITNTKAQVKDAKTMAAGNLIIKPKPVSDRDQLGQALAQMAEQLRGLVTAVKHSTTQINQSIGSLDNEAGHLAQGAIEQFSSVESVSAALHEIEAQIKQTASNSEHVTDLVNSALLQAQEGNQQMEKLSAAIVEIEVSGEQIADIMGEITSITEQTNLIALNAAIEAARAGEHGRGFSVVADEVRNLAQRSNVAADKARQLVDLNRSSIKQGQQITQFTIKAFNSIVTEVEESALQTSTIAEACKEQSSATSELSSGLDQIDTVSKQVSKNAELVSQQCHQLSQLAESLNDNTSRLQTT